MHRSRSPVNRHVSSTATATKTLFKLIIGDMSVKSGRRARSINSAAVRTGRCKTAVSEARLRRPKKLGRGTGGSSIPSHQLRARAKWAADGSGTSFKYFEKEGRGRDVNSLYCCAVY